MITWLFYGSWKKKKSRIRTLVVISEDELEFNSEEDNSLLASLQEESENEGENELENKCESKSAVMYY